MTRIYAPRHSRTRGGPSIYGKYPPSSERRSETVATHLSFVGGLRLETKTQIPKKQKLPLCSNDVKQFLPSFYSLNGRIKLPNQIPHKLRVFQ